MAKAANWTFRENSAGARGAAAGASARQRYQRQGCRRALDWELKASWSTCIRVVMAVALCEQWSSLSHFSPAIIGRVLL